jgi:hypothetical protein
VRTCVENKGLRGRPARSQAADWARLAVAWDSLRHDLALKAASGERESHVVLGAGAHLWAGLCGAAISGALGSGRGCRSSRCRKPHPAAALAELLAWQAGGDNVRKGRAYCAVGMLSRERHEA